MARDITIFEQQHAFETITFDSAKILEDLKNDIVLKKYTEVEPILNAILTHKRLSNDDQLLFINHIKNNINIYYYMGDKDTFIKLVHYDKNKLNDLYQQIKQDDYPKDFKITTDTLKSLPTPNLKEIYKIRYKDLLLRYIKHLLNVFK